ncbi:MAG: hypothetical protein AAFU03_17390, partial [Bacteroidota bacterium]
HTGNFLPAYINGGAYGTRLDSANVTLLRDLARRGFVGISASYRQGWLPLATDLTTRTETLLKAAYRGGQDAHSLARFLRKTVVEDENPYQIDTSRIVFWGFGTGGYVTMTHAFLDRSEEILTNDQFYDTEGNPLINEPVDSDPQGIAPTPLNNPNHVGYSSNVAMSVNTGGALGDPVWIEGQDHEPMILGQHSFTDPFAPYYTGTVIVPTTGETVVSGVAGSNLILELADDFGLNDALADANALDLPDIYPPLSEVLNQINAQLSQLMVTSPVNLTGDTFNLSRPNLLPAVYDRLIAGPYNWFDSTTLALILTQFPLELRPNIDDIIDGEDFSNPNWRTPEDAKKNLDTMLAHFIPRAYIGLQLDQVVSSTEDLVDAAAIGLEIAPNPAGEFFTV